MTVLDGNWRRPAPPHARGGGTEKRLLIALALIIFLLSLAPLGRLVWTALAPQGQLDLSRLGRLLAQPRVAQATFNTLWLALGSTALALLLGTLAAVLVQLSDMRHKPAWVFVFILPLMIPPQVSALAWLQAWSPGSALLNLIGISPGGGGRHPLYSAGGIILLLGLHNAPLVFLTVRAALRRIPADLLEAARAGGAGPWRLVFTIILPLARSALYAGGALSFVAAAGNFGIQAMLGIPARMPTLITLIYQRLNGSGPQALPDMAVLSLLMALITLSGLMIAGWLGQRLDVRVGGGKGAGQSLMPLGRWRLLSESLAWLLMLATLLLPLSALLVSSLTRGYGQPLNWHSLTIDNYLQALLHHQAIRQAFITSLGLSAGTALVLMVMALLLGYFLTWRRRPWMRFMQFSTELAYALPGIVIGIAAMLFFLPPLPWTTISLYGSVWVILAAYLANYLALVLRPALSGYAQLEPSLDEAARVCGAGFMARLRDIIGPLAAPAVAAGAIMVFLSAFNEIQISILLVSARVQTIGPMIIFLEEGGAPTLSAAVGCLMVLAVLLMMLLLSAARKRLPAGVLPWQP